VRTPGDVPLFGAGSSSAKSLSLLPASQNLQTTYPSGIGTPNGEVDPEQALRSAPRTGGKREKADFG
jgi:hypothetical protein